MRVLQVVPPLAGHVNPTVALGRALAARGHDVAWVAYPEAVAPLLPPGATLLPLAHGLRADQHAAIRAEGAGLRGAAAFKFLFERFLVPLADAMVPGVEEAVRRFGADVIVVDQQAYAGALAATRLGLPWVTSSSTSAGLVDLLAELPQLAAWRDEALTALRTRWDAPSAAADLLSPHAVIAWTVEALVGRALPAPIHPVGPAVAPRVDVPFPWEVLADGVPRVLVSLGTVNAEIGGRFFGVALEALAGLDVQGIVVAPDGLLGPVPPNVLVRPRVPQLQLLPHVHAVVCHGGHNTVVEALAHGLPLVVAPIRDDQPVVAQQVVDAGAGVRVKFGRVRADALRAAITSALHDPDLRAGAARLRDALAAAGGPDRAARVVEAVAGRDRP